MPFGTKKRVNVKSLRDRLAQLENDSEEEELEVITSSDRAEVAALTAVASSSSLLSFADEEGDTDTFIVKKKRHRIRNLNPRRSNKNANDNESMDTGQHNVAAGPGSNSGQPVVLKDGGGSRNSPDSSTADVASARREKVWVAEADSTSVGTSGDVAMSWTLNGEEMEAVENGKQDVPDELRVMLKTGNIPDAKTIHLARKRRQEARDAGGDYIPLEETRRPVGPEANSRLVREDDNDFSDEDAGGVMSARDPKEDSRRMAVREEFLNVEQGDSDNERDQEFDIWEREQLNKAVSKNKMDELHRQDDSADPMGPPAGLPSLFESTMYSTAGPHAAGYAPHQLYSTNGAMAYAGPAGRGTSAAVTTYTPLTLNDVKSRLDETLTESRSFNSQQKLNQEKATDNMISNADTIAQLETAAPELHQRYRFYQKTQAFVLDLLDCWNEKVPRLEALEASIERAWRERRDYLVKRRRLEVQDEYQECSARALGNLDELLKTGERRIRVTEREARRNRRRKSRSKLTSMDHQEGMSSDDEQPPSRVQVTKASVEKAKADIDQLFVDIDENYSSLASVLWQMDDWRSQYPDAFREAFVAQCVPKLVGPIIRRELLHWNPVLGPSGRFEESPWFAELVQFASEEDEDGPVAGVEPGSLKNDPKYCVIPSMVEKVICPKLQSIVELSWDCVSSSEGKRLSYLITKLVHQYPTLLPENKNFKLVMETVIERLKSCVDEDLFIPLYPASVLDNKASGAADFSKRQFWFCVKVLKNIMLWEGVLSDKVLQSLAVEGVVNRYLILGLQTGVKDFSFSLTKTETVISCFPDRLFHSDVVNLESLARWCLKLAGEVHQTWKNSSDSRDSDEPVSIIKRLQLLLKKLKRIDLALEIAQKYRIQH